MAPLPPGVAERRSPRPRPPAGTGLRRTAALPTPSSPPPTSLPPLKRRGVRRRAPEAATPHSSSIPTTTGEQEQDERRPAPEPDDLDQIPCHKAPSPEPASPEGEHRVGNQVYDDHAAVERGDEER